MIKKFWALSLKILLAAPALLCVLLIRALRPLVIIRLGRLDISRIGGIYSADWYFSERFLRGYDKKRYDIFYFTTVNKVICNRQWLKIWARVLRIFPSRGFALMVDKIQRMIWKEKFQVVPLVSVNQLQEESIRGENRNLEYILAYKKPHIFFSGEEEAFGQKGLAEFGIPKGNPFICFHVRDSAYLQTTYRGENWDYHDYRDSKINNYLLAAQKLVGRGYYAVRMGSIVKEKLNSIHPAIIDYSTSGKRTEFLDIYLGAKCKFFLCSDTGISIIPEMFRRPVVYVNWTLINRMSPWVLKGLFIFKKFYSHKQNRLLTFYEAMNLRFGGIETKKFLDERGIELIENTPEEIWGVVDEMERRLNGTWQTTPEDEQLQERFWTLFGPHKLKSAEVRIGCEFLRQNRRLLTQSLTPQKAEVGSV